MARGFNEGLSKRDSRSLGAPSGKRIRDLQTSESQARNSVNSPEDVAQIVSDAEVAELVALGGFVEEPQAEASEDESFETVPFVGAYRKSVVPYIWRLKENEIDDSKPCPSALIDALKKTGVTIENINKKERIVTISQTLKNGHTKKQDLSSRGVLKFLKAVVSKHEVKYKVNPVYAKDANVEATSVAIPSVVEQPLTTSEVKEELNTLPSNEPFVTTQDELVAQNSTVETPSGVSDSALNMDAYRAHEAELLRRREEIKRLYPDRKEKIETAPLDAPETSSYDVVKFSKRSESYLKSLTIKNLQIPNHWPQQLMAALEETGAENIHYEHQKLGARLVFSLATLNDGMEEFKMNAQEGATFLKGLTQGNDPIVAPVSTEAAIAKSVAPLRGHGDSFDSTVVRAKVTPEMLRRHFKNFLEKNNRVIETIDPDAHFDEETNELVIYNNEKVERLRFAEAQELVNEFLEREKNAPTTVSDTVPSVAVDGRKSLLGLADEALSRKSLAEFEAEAHARKVQEGAKNSTVTIQEPAPEPSVASLSEEQQPSVEPVEIQLSSDGEDDERVYAWFERDLGISADVLNSVPGFTELPYLKKVSILENIKDLQRDFVHEKVDGAYAVDREQRRAQTSVLGSNQIGKWWFALQEKLAVNERSIRRGNEIDSEISKAKMVAPEELLTALVKGVHTPVAVMEDGKLRTLFRESLALEPDETLTIPESMDVAIATDLAPNDTPEPSEKLHTNNGAEIADDVRPIPIPKTPETKSPNREPAFDKRFRETFGMTHEVLKQIDGFEQLSLPQQKMVYENLVQSTYGMAKEEALGKYTRSKDRKRARAVEAYGKLAGNAWSAIREVITKDVGLLKAEKKVVSEFEHGGLMTKHRTIIKQLVKSMSKFGPRVHEDEKTGELLVDLVHINFDRENREAEYEAVRKLNETAHKFAKIPLSWREDTLGVDGGKEKEWGITKFIKKHVFDSRKKHLKYEESEKAFSEARGILEQTLREGGKNDKEIAEILLGVDSRVNQLQFMQTSPDAVEELSRITDKSIFMQVAKSLVTKSGGLGYMAAGYLGRFVATGVIGWFGAPVVSAGLAASMSWNKTAAELRERDRNARMGVKDNAEGALNIVSADLMVRKTRLLINRYNTLQEKIFGQLFEGVDSADDLKNEIALLEQIKERVTYIHDKQKLNKVDYGTRDQSIGKQVELYEILGEATALVHGWVDPHDEKHVVNRERHIERLTQATKVYESNIEAKRRSYRRYELGKQALKAGGFALAGAYIADYFKGPDLATEVAKVKGVETTAFVVEEQTTSPIQPISVSDSIRETIFSHEPSPSSEADVIAAPEKVMPLTYTIKPGDTLTKILKEQLPDIKNIGNPVDKERALANLFKSLTPNELRAIGVRSENVGEIFTGSTLKLDKLAEIIKLKGGIYRFLRH